MGPIGLHGGGEFLPGDEAFLDSLLLAAAAAAERRRSLAANPAGSAALHGADVEGHALLDRPTIAAEPIRVVILPTAAARGRPAIAAANGVAAFEERRAATGHRLRVDVARVVDAASAEDPECARILAAADLVHLPGGDPDLIPTIIEGTAAHRALLSARERGAVIAGASAGAMALAEWSWTPRGGIHGLGFVRGLAVVPHYDDIRRTAWQAALDELAPGGIGYLGLDERTGVIGNGSGHWRVAGEGAAYWFARGATVPEVGRHGEVLPLPV